VLDDSLCEIIVRLSLSLISHSHCLSVTSAFLSTSYCKNLLTAAAQAGANASSFLEKLFRETSIKSEGDESYS